VIADIPAPTTVLNTELAEVLPAKAMVVGIGAGSILLSGDSPFLLGFTYARGMAGGEFRVFEHTLTPGGGILKSAMALGGGVGWKHPLPALGPFATAWKGAIYYTGQPVGPIDTNTSIASQPTFGLQIALPLTLGAWDVTMMPQLEGIYAQPYTSPAGSSKTGIGPNLSGSLALVKRWAPVSWLDFNFELIPGIAPGAFPFASAPAPWHFNMGTNLGVTFRFLDRWALALAASPLFINNEFTSAEAYHNRGLLRAAVEVGF